MKSIGVVLSGGIGARFNNNIPKQYHYINGKRVIDYVVSALKQSKVDEIIVLCSDKYYSEIVEKELGVKTLLGGATRNKTIGNALKYVKENNYEKVLFLDSARPNISKDYINDCLDLLEENDAVITAAKITDSLGKKDEKFIDRSNYFLIQAPECFKTKVLNNFNENLECTAIVQQLNDNDKIYYNYNCENNLKITYASDILMAEKILKNRFQTIGVILAAGIGQRFGSIVHKQYLKLNGKEVLSYAIERMSKCKNIDKIVLVVDKEEYESHYIEQKYKVECICGGETRNISIKRALNYINDNYSCNKILFHDATRPLVKKELYEQCVDELKDCDCVIAYQDLTDSLCDQFMTFVDRDNYKLIQTPEVFWFNKLFPVFDENSVEKTIVGQLKNPKIHFKKTDNFSFKITYPRDLFLAEQLDKINYYELSKDHKLECDFTDLNVLVFGGAGGVGSVLIEKLKKMNCKNVKAPTRDELDLKNITVEKINEFCLDFIPDIIINTAAVSFDDSEGIVEKFDEIFNVNLKSNLVIIDYAKSLNKKVKFVVISSSSSTKGRVNITNYSASKCALNSVIESLANVLQKNDVYINAIIPEKINTPMIQKLHKTNISTRELLDVDSVVDAILYLCSSDFYGQLVHLRRGL